MKALVFDGQRVQLKNRPDPTPEPGEVLVDVRLAGICNTDLEIARGYLQFRGVLGHEVIGEVRSGSIVPREVGGRRVAIEINCACGRCGRCIRGDTTHCPTRTVLGIVGKDGGLAEQIAVPAVNLHPIPDWVPDDVAVFTEPLAAAMHTFDEIQLKRTDRILIIGDGKLGLLIGFALMARKEPVAHRCLLGRHPEKLALARAVGLETVLESDFDEKDYDIVVEASGQPSGLARAMTALRPRGLLILKSTYAPGERLDLSPIVIQELIVRGSRCGDFPRAIHALADGVIDPRPLIAARYPLSQAESAFRRAGERGTLKILVSP